MGVDDRVPTELKKAIMQARMDKKLTQSQLAQVILCVSLSVSGSPDFDSLGDSCIIFFYR